METIVWITPEYFIETDFYVVPELAKYYKIIWLIEHGNVQERIPFYDDLKKIKENNLSIEYVMRPAVHPLSMKMAAFYWKLVSKIKTYKSDVVYSAILGIQYIPFMFLRIPRRKVVFAAHNVTTPKGVKQYALTKLFMGTTLRLFKNFQNFSKSQYDVLRSQYKNKNNFYAPFVLKDYGTPNVSPGETIFFLSYGRIRGYKCIDVLIDAAQKVKETCSIPFKVIIAGECSEWDMYQKRIKYPDIFDLRIKNVDNADVPNLFGESHYTVLPYQDIAQSGALFVCINYSKPSILSALPAFEEYIEDGYDGLFIRPANVDDLTEKMRYVIENHNVLYPKLVANLNIMKTENFDKDSIIKRYKDYFESLICRS